MQISEIRIDIETYSSNNLLKGGVYKYVEAFDFQILWFSYKLDGVMQPRLDLTRQQIPAHVVAAIKDPKVKKYAFNAAFERICLSRHLGFDTDKGVYIDPEGWHCTKVSAARAGYPLSLKTASMAIGMSQLKSESGKSHIAYFSSPCKPTKTNGKRTRNLPEHDPEKYEDFGAYCDQDVIVEDGVDAHTSYLPVIEMEHKLWQLDQKINDKGVHMDVRMILNAMDIHKAYTDTIKEEAKDITGLANPNSPKQLIAWLVDNGEEVEDLKKATVADNLKKLKDVTIEDLMRDLQKGDIQRVYEIRQELAKTSVKKYAAMRHVANKDHRARGLFQYYGANRTGRWAGKLVQMQNLTKHYMKDVDLARELVQIGDGELLEMCYGNVPDTLSQLIRTVFTPAPGNIFTVVDFSAIEARVLAWLAGEQWRLDVFATHGEIYEASASKMFGVPFESVLGEKKDKNGVVIRAAGANYHLRAKGKVAELALGYQGWTNALIQMGALGMGIQEEELPEIAGAWRDENQNIVKYWKAVQNAAITALQNPGQNVRVGYVTFFTKRRNLYIKLPSGRILCYVKARLARDSKKRTVVKYWGMHTKTKKWCELDTYGGKITENITQAIARDCLGVALIRIDEAGYPIVGHVHDEIIIEHDYGVLHEVEDIMAQNIDWAPGLPLKAEGFEGLYYKK